jgi:hypothetical protein
VRASCEHAIAITFPTHSTTPHHHTSLTTTITHQHHASPSQTTTTHHHHTPPPRITITNHHHTPSHTTFTQQVPAADIVVVPISGGGLISGVATAIKGAHMCPHVT